MTLPNDIARCRGIGSDTEGWREGCDTCLRRTAPRGGSRADDGAAADHYIFLSV